MSDIALLLFGAAVSFIVVCGVYVYARESFTLSEESARPQPQKAPAPRQPRRLRDVA